MNLEKKLTVIDNYYINKKKYSKKIFWEPIYRNEVRKNKIERIFEFK